MRRADHSSTAYTLIEVLVVVSILGILGAIVVPSLLSAGTMGVQGAVRRVVADLILAQNEAVAAQDNRAISFDAANERYGMFDATRDVGTAATVPLQMVQMPWLPQVGYSFDYAGNNRTGADAAGRNFIVDFTKGEDFQDVVIVQAQFPAGSTQNWVEFDELGAPLTGGFVDLRSGGATFRVNVAAFTGRITIVEQ